MNISLNKKDLNAAAAALDAHLAAKSGFDFCKAWPVARPVLQAIGDALGGLAALAVKFLIGVGDTYAAKHCKA